VVIDRDGEVFTQAFTGDQDMQTFGRFKDKGLMRPGEVQKEIEIIVKRGAGVDYAQKEGSPYFPVGDIRFDRPGMTWKDVKAQMNNMWDGPDYDSGTDEEIGDEIVDEYSHVDDYSWPPLHELSYY
jgi:hypothetical protein